MKSLFDMKSVRGDSPRLAWMKLHHVKTKNFTDVKTGDEDEFGNEVWPWIAFDTRCEEDLDAFDLCGAATEDEAIAALARRLNLRLWNETNASPASGQ